MAEHKTGLLLFCWQLSTNAVTLWWQSWWTSNPKQENAGVRSLHLSHFYLQQNPWALKNRRLPQGNRTPEHWRDKRAIPGQQNPCTEETQGLSQGLLPLIFFFVQDDYPVKACCSSALREGLVYLTDMEKSGCLFGTLNFWSVMSAPKTHKQKIIWILKSFTKDV